MACTISVKRARKKESAGKDLKNISRKNTNLNIILFEHHFPMTITSLIMDSQDFGSSVDMYPYC